MDNTSCIKTHGFVYATARIHSLSQAATGIFFGLPEGFRPAEVIYCYGWMSVSGQGTMVATTYISSNGNVTTNVSNGLTCTQVAFFAVFPIYTL